MPSSAAGPTRPAPSPGTPARRPPCRPGRGGVQHDRGEVEEHAVEGLGRSATAVPAAAASQIEVTPFSRSARRASCADRALWRRPHVPAVGGGAVGRAPRHERRAPGHARRRQLRGVVGGVERGGPRCRPGWARSACRPRRPAGASSAIRRDLRSTASTAATQAAWSRRGSVDEREVLRLVGERCGPGFRCRPSRVHAPPPSVARSTADAGHAGGRRPRRRWHGGRSLCSGRDHRCRSRSVPQHARRSGRSHPETGLDRSDPGPSPASRCAGGAVRREDRVALHTDRLLRQRGLGGPAVTATVRDRELAAVAGADR